MADVMIDHLSASIYKLTLKYAENTLGCATGFVVNAGGVSYLVTNWHVLSGRNVHDGQPSNRCGATPDHLEIQYLGEDLDLERPNRITIDLVGTSGDALWLEHPTGKRVDIAAIVLNPPEAGCFRPVEMSDSDHYFRMIVTVQMPIVVIGYPYGDRIDGVLPVWKTGAIASEPALDYSANIPAILIDATTRQGMSGSPVLVRTSGPFDCVDGKKYIGGNVKTKFLGIYSGRVADFSPGRDDTAFSSELGLCWRQERVVEVLAHGVPGLTVPFLGERDLAR